MNIKIIFRNIGHFISFPFVAISLKLGLNKARKLYKMYYSGYDEMSESERYEFVNKQVAKASFLSNCRLIVFGLDKIPNVPVLFVCNHKSEFDPLILIKIFSQKEMIKSVFVSKIELEQKKGIGEAAKLIDTIFIDRNNIRSAIKCLEQEKKVLQSKNVVVFLEGTRITTHEFGEFKSAALEPAFSTMRPIVPVVIQGSIGVEPSNAKGFLRYKEVNVKFLPAIKYNEYIGFSRDAIAEKLKKQMQKIYDDYEKENKSIFYKGSEQKYLIDAKIDEDISKKNNIESIVNKQELAKNIQSEEKKSNDVVINKKQNNKKETIKHSSSKQNKKPIVNSQKRNNNNNKNHSKKITNSKPKKNTKKVIKKNQSK